MNPHIAALPFGNTVVFYNYTKANAPYVKEITRPLLLPTAASFVVMQSAPWLRWLILIKNVGILEVAVPPGEVDIFAGMSSTEIVEEITAVMRKERRKVGNYEFNIHRAPCFFEGGPVFSLEEILLRNEVNQMRAYFSSM